MVAGPSGSTMNTGAALGGISDAAVVLGSHTSSPLRPTEQERLDSWLAVFRYFVGPGLP